MDSGGTEHSGSLHDAKRHVHTTLMSLGREEKEVHPIIGTPVNVNKNVIDPILKDSINTGSRCRSDQGQLEANT